MTISLQGKIILLHGPPKVGKTQVASSFPGKVKWFATEAGHDYIPEEQKKDLVFLPGGANGWVKFRNETPKLTPESKTIPIDITSDLYAMCLDYLCAKNKWEHVGDPPMGKGWAALRREFALGISNFIAKAKVANGSTVIFIEHTETQEIRTGSEIYHKLGLAMSGQCHGIIAPIPDHIWMLGYGAETHPGNLNTYSSERVLFISGNRSVEAGTRDPKVEIETIENLPKTGQYDFILKELNNHKKENTNG